MGTTAEHEVLEQTSEMERTLTKKDINRSFYRWYLDAEIPNCYERQQGVSFCYSMIPCLKKLYPEKEALSRALTRHLNFFNSQGTWSTPIHGITLSMEEEMANEGAISDAAITGIKTGLMGPLAGIGDTIDWGTLKTIIYGIAVTFGAAGNVLGAIIPFAFMLITFFIGKNLWGLGYKIGKESVKSILEAGWIKELISATSILGLFMMGALSASYVTLSTALQFKVAGTEIVLQDILNSIAPGLLPLAAVFGIYYILKNKTQKYGRISLGIVVVCILGALIGIF